MNFKSYATSLDTPRRMSRKQQRRSVFVFNSKLKKLTKRPRSGQKAS